jgi:hypothetical protein
MRREPVVSPDLAPPYAGICVTSGSMGGLEPTCVYQGWRDGYRQKGRWGVYGQQGPVGVF